MATELKNFLGPELNSLYSDGEKLLSSDLSGLSDYSFVVFPFAKVYEGFLKKLFFKIGAINQQQYESDHWRVGKALNPNLEKDLRHESVYDRLNPQTAEILWQAWKNGRNQIFHFWPGRSKPLTLEVAKEVIREIGQAMEKALEECEI